RAPTGSRDAIGCDLTRTLPSMEHRALEAFAGMDQPQCQELKRPTRDVEARARLLTKRKRTLDAQSRLALACGSKPSIEKLLGPRVQVRAHAGPTAWAQHGLTVRRKYRMINSILLVAAPLRCVSCFVFRVSCLSSPAQKAGDWAAVLQKARAPVLRCLELSNHVCCTIVSSQCQLQVVVGARAGARQP